MFCCACSLAVEKVPPEFEVPLELICHVQVCLPHKRTSCLQCKHASSMQVWLQYFAWTESSVVSKVQKRTDFGGLQDKLPLSKEPMFCFETAVKLLYWCGLAYEYQEVDNNGSCML